MSLQIEFRTAVLSHGNKQSSFKTYWPHVQEFIEFTRQRRGKHISRDDVDRDDVYRWRDHLAGKMQFSPASCNQRTSAIKFLFLHVIQKPLVEYEGRPIRMRQPAHRRKRMVSREQMRAFFEALNFRDRLIAELMYATTSRLDDVMKTRIKDYNFDDEQVEIADCKHDHFRVCPLPKSLHENIRRQMRSVAVRHEMDADENPNGVPVGFAYARKAKNAPRDYRWYWLFPSDSLSRDPGDGKLKRYHLDKNNIRKRFSAALKKAGIHRLISAHDIRRASATHLHYYCKMPLADIQKLLGHNDIRQTIEYIMEFESTVDGKMSPYDQLMID